MDEVKFIILQTLPHSIVTIIYNNNTGLLF